MTWFFSGAALNFLAVRRGGRPCPPVSRTAAPCRAGPMCPAAGAVGRADHVPVGRGDHTPLHGRGSSFPCRARAAWARVSGQRMAAQRRYESKAQGLHIPIRGAGGNRHRQHLSRGKDLKTLVLTAFFGYFLPLLAESTTPSAHGKGCGTKDYGLPRPVTSATGLAMTHPKISPVIPHQCAHRCGNPFPL